MHISIVSGRLGLLPNLPGAGCAASCMKKKRTNTGILHHRAVRWVQAPLCPPSVSAAALLIVQLVCVCSLEPLPFFKVYVLPYQVLWWRRFSGEQRCGASNFVAAAALLFRFLPASAMCKTLPLLLLPVFFVEFMVQQFLFSAP